jgi:hypothetical protein
MRSLLVGVMLVALATLAACGGNQASSAAATASQGSGASTGGEQSEPAAATPSQNPGGGGGGADLDSLVTALTPANSTQVSRTDAEGGVIISWTSTESVDSLKSFYEGAIPGTGMKIFSTTNAGGGYSWIFAETEGSSHGGSVTLAPNSDGSGGSTVIMSATTE